VKTALPSFCAHCAHGWHQACPGTCVCAEATHRPNDVLARRMAVYLRPDVDGGVDQDSLVARIRGTR